MKLLKLTIEDSLGVITLANPPFNLISMEMFDEFELALDQINESNSRAILINAEGPFFSAGIEVSSVFEGRSSKEAQEMLTRFMGILGRFEQLPMPTLAVVQGDAITAGFELVLACDMAWVADTAKLGLVEATIGTIPMGGGLQRLNQRVGSARASEMIMSASMYSAKDLERWNVINRVLTKEQLLEKSLRFASRLANGPTLAHAATKKLKYDACNHGILHADYILPELAAPLFESQDMLNGINSFLKDGPGNAEFNGK